MPDDRQDASDFTKAVNDELLELLPFEDRRDFEDAARGHIADVSGSVVHAPDGRVTWDPNKFAFVGEGSRARRRSTPACGASRSCAPRAACSRWSSACTRCATTTSPTSPSSRATPA